MVKLKMNDVIWWLLSDGMFESGNEGTRELEDVWLVR